MIEVLQIAYEVIFPILLIAGLSAALRKTFILDPATLSRTAMYLFIPALTFNSIAKSELSFDEIRQIMTVVILLAIANLGLGWWVARQLGLERTTQSAFMLAVTFINGANYGLPFIEFAFGKTGLEKGVVVMVTTLTLTFTAGVYVASWGQASVKDSVQNVFKVPMVYAAFLGFLFNVLNLHLPLAMGRAADLLAQAAIPIMLVILGIQLAQISLHEQTRRQLTALGWAAFLRLVITPVIVYGLTALLGITGLTQQVLITQLSMPTAVNTIILATEFKSDTEFTTANIFISTLSSVVTLSVLLALVS